MKKHMALRTRMLEKDVSQRELARRIGVSVAWFSQKMTGKRPFYVSEAWEIMKALSINPENMAQYFPNYESGGAA